MFINKKMAFYLYFETSVYCSGRGVICAIGCVSKSLSEFHRSEKASHYARFYIVEGFVSTHFFLNLKVIAPKLCK